MPAARTSFALSLALSAACGVHAEEVYKCTNSHGAIAYQDHACAAGDTETVVPIEPAPTRTPTSAPAPVADTPPVEVAPPPAAATEPPPPRKPLPPLWLCTRPEDGSQYASRDGVVQPRLVPLGVLGYPGKSLAQAYAPGSNVMSAPELSRPPIDRSPQAASASQYTEIMDQCVRASPDQTCEWLRKEYNRIQAKLRRAFKDEQAVLQPQEDELDDELSGC